MLEEMHAFLGEEIFDLHRVIDTLYVKGKAPQQMLRLIRKCNGVSAAINTIIVT